MRARKPTEEAPPAAEAGRYAYEGLDRSLHEKARLGIMTSLMTRADGLLFNDLKKLCALTDGNLSRHIQVLSEAGLVEVRKGAERGRPQTLYRLTPLGKRRFLEYIAELEKVIQDAHPARARCKRGEADPIAGLPAGWVPG